MCIMNLRHLKFVKMIGIFKVGDFIFLKQLKDTDATYNGNYILAKITYILMGGKFGIAEDYCILSFRIIEKNNNNTDLPF